MFGCRMAVDPFLELVKCNIVRNWSIDGVQGDMKGKFYAFYPRYSLEEQTKAYQWINKNKIVDIKEVACTKLFFIPTATNNHIDNKIVETYMTIRDNPEVCKSLDELHKSVSSLWCLALNENDWESGQCNCPYFAKNFKCKHLLALSSLQNISGAIIPENAKKILIKSNKHKRSEPDTE